MQETKGNSIKIERSWKKDQMEILEMKISISQLKKSVESHSSWLDQMEDRISGPEDKVHVIEKSIKIKIKWRSTNRICKNSGTSLKDQTNKS
jgi:hypothetical protein